MGRHAGAQESESQMNDHVSRILLDRGRYGSGGPFTRFMEAYGRFRAKSSLIDGCFVIKYNNILREDDETVADQWAMAQAKIASVVSNKDLEVRKTGY